MPRVTKRAAEARTTGDAFSPLTDSPIAAPLDGVQLDVEGVRTVETGPTPAVPDSDPQHRRTARSDGGPVDGGSAFDALNTPMHHPGGDCSSIAPTQPISADLNSSRDGRSGPLSIPETEAAELQDGAGAPQKKDSIGEWRVMQSGRLACRVAPGRGGVERWLCTSGRLLCAHGHTASEVCSTAGQICTLTQPAALSF